MEWGKRRGLLFSHVREFGFPDEKELQSPSLAVRARQGSFAFQPTKHERTAQAFTGVSAIIDGCASAITVMVYGCLSTTLLAFGTVMGEVWTLQLNPGNNKLQKLLEHEEEVRDVDWSRDNGLLLSCSINGCVCLTSVERTHVCRKWIANTRTTCCKFHPLNQNMVIVGGGGCLYMFNCSTGAQVQRITIIPSPIIYLTAMVCTGSYVLLGDSTGGLRVYKMKFANNLLQLTALGSPFAHPTGESSSIAGIDIRTYSNICKGQAAVVSYEDSTLAIYKIGISANPKVELFSSLAMAPIDRRVKAVWRPATDIDQPEHIAIGGEHANVHVYNFTAKGAPALVNVLSAHEAPVMTVCWSYDGHEFISGDENGTIIVWKQKSRGKSEYHSFG